MVALSVQEHVDCGTTPEAPLEDSEQLRQQAISQLREGFHAASGLEASGQDVAFDEETILLTSHSVFDVLMEQMTCVAYETNDLK